MEEKDIVPRTGIEITKPDKRIAISEGGVEIHHENKPVSGEVAEIGYVYLVVDCSGSMEGVKIRHARSGALNFGKDALGKGYLTGLIRFETHTNLLCEPQKDIKLLSRNLEKLIAGGATIMAEAIKLAHQMLKKKKGNRVIVVVTDGLPNGPGDPQASLKAGANAKKDGIDIITIGTDDASEEFLKKLASKSELGVKVSRVHFEQTITSTAKLLPSGREHKIIRR
jgi:Mg-chelatase subunit ChlD